MEKNKISTLVLLILGMILIVIIILYIRAIRNNNITISEEQYRNQLKANLTYDYVTKPSEEQNAQMEQQEKEQNEEMQERENAQMQEEINNMVEEFDVNPGVTQ